MFPERVIFFPQVSIIFVFPSVVTTTRNKVYFTLKNWMSMKVVYKVKLEI